LLLLFALITMMGTRTAMAETNANGFSPNRFSPANAQQEQHKWSVKQVSAGGYHTMILLADGTLWACGHNDCGQLGDGTTTDTNIPKQVMSDVASVATGHFHTMILKTDGTLWVCGYNEFGQLGDGTTTDTSTPKQVMSGVSAVSAGDAHTLIVKTDGTLWACGNNKYGQLGDGNTTNVHTPKQVMSGVATVSADLWHSMIIKKDGTLWACGSNYYGQLGIGTTTNTRIPKQVMSGVADVSAGTSHTMILKTDGTLWACGANEYGQLGDGGATSISTPKQVLSGVYSMSAGVDYTMIIKTNGTLWACGHNDFGQLGDGTTNNRYAPKQVMSDVSAVSARGKFTMIQKTDGTLWACGVNDYGQLGDGSNTNQLSPVQISGGTTEQDTDYTDISHYQNVVYVEPVSIFSDRFITLPVKMKNAQANISGFQFDLLLPEGVTVAKDDDDSYLIELSTDRTTTRKHTVSAQQQADGSIRVICYSNNNSTFSGTDGNVLTMTLQVAADAPTGETALKLRDVVMTTPSLDSYSVPWVVSMFVIEDYLLGDVNSDKVVNVVDVAGAVNLILNSGDTSLLNRKAADVNADGSINVVDIAGIVNIILGTANAATSLAESIESEPFLDFSLNPSDVLRGETTTMHIQLHPGDDNFTGCQFDLYLPEGLSVAEEDGFPLVDIGSGTTARRHTVSTSVQPDGALRVVCYSNNNSVFNVTDQVSEILTAVIKIAEDATEGECNIALRNITLSRPDVTGVNVSDWDGTSCTIVSSGIEDIMATSGSATKVYSLSGQRLTAPRKGVNIVEGKKVVVK